MGIGLAVDSGMYEVFIFSTLLVIVGLEFLKRLFSSVIPKVIKLNIDVIENESIQRIIDELTKADIGIKDYQLKLERDSEEELKHQVLIKLQSQKS